MRTSTSIIEPAEPDDSAPSAARAVAGKGGLGWPAAAAGTVTGVFLLSNSATPLYAHWQAEWGFDSGLLTVIFATYMVGLIAALVVAGRMADRFGRKAVLVPGLSAAVLSSLLFLGAQNVAWLLIARLLAGGLAASGAHSPQHLVFGIVAGIEALALSVAIVLPLRRPSQPSTGRLLAWPSAPLENRRELRWGIAAFAPGITSTSFVLSLGPTVLRSVGVSGTFVAGAVACAMFLVAAGVQFALARLTTRAHLALSSIAAIAAMIAVVLAVTVAPAVVLVVVAALLAGTAQGLGQLAGLSLIATHVPAEKRAESNAVLNIGGYIPAGALSVAVGYAADAFGLPTAVTLFGAVVTLAALVALVTTTASVDHHVAEATTEDEQR